jgi:hypothetical protein
MGGLQRHRFVITLNTDLSRRMDYIGNQFTELGAITELGCVPRLQAVT